MPQRYNIFLAQRAKLGKMKKEKILHPSVATGFNDTARRVATLDSYRLARYLRA